MKTAPRTKKSEHTHTVHIYKLYCSYYTLMYTDIYTNFHKSKCKEVTMFTSNLLEIFMSYYKYDRLQCITQQLHNRMQNFTENSTVC